ncbi:MAG: hypothetical protein KDI56_11735 [Xanthomonadales bacterium]|nr:hypothetical protein [Xanthomonadales bacterium]
MKCPMLVCLAFLAGSVSANAKSDFSEEDFARLGFLQGQWQGTGPDGALFYEQYAFEGTHRLVSSRYADANFDEVTDRSVVELAAGSITSSWDVYRWQASEVVDGKACFDPVAAPSRFCWERIDTRTVHVTQQWDGEDGQPQSHVVVLQRLD